MLRAALHVARARQDAELGDQARALLARLAEDRFLLAVVGQFSRGKSTLMNAILGAAHLPTGALPMTSVVTTVHYGDRPRATVRRRGSPIPIETPLAELSRFVAQSSAERSELHVVSADVEVPAEILRLGFAFVDTPGVGSAIEANTATTKRFLPEADAVIFLTGFDSPLTGAEVEFLADVRRHVDKLFFVINKRDLVSERDAADVAEFVRRRLGDDMRLGELRLFAVSALEALQARTQGDDERLAASGLLALEADLVGFLTTEKARLFLLRVAARAANLVARQRRDLQLGRLGPDRATVAEAFEVRMNDLVAEQRRVADAMARRVEAELPRLFDIRRAAWQGELAGALAPHVERVAAEAAAGPADRASIEDARDRLQHTARQVGHDWLARRTAEVRELLVGVMAGELDVLLRLCRSPGSLGAELAGLTIAQDESETAGWSGTDLPSLLVPEIEWTVAPVPLRRFRLVAAARARDIRQRLLDGVAAAIAGQCDRTREVMLTAARSWVAELVDEADRALLASAERFRRNLDTRPSEDDVTAVEELAQRLAAFRAAVQASEPRTGRQHAVASAVDAGRTEPALSPRNRCVVCDRLAATLGDYLRHDQFELATREHSQAHHANGGYCSLHTWQYADIATGIGISAGYAQLAESTADALQTVERRSTTVAELGRGVAALDQRTQACPICAALHEAERDAVTGAASEWAPATDTEGPPLCLHHLAAVLGAGPPPDRARSLIRGLAAALQRASEDMRAYALKREALHRDLIVNEEERAHLDTLHFLAGRPDLVRSRPAQD